jgi:DNA-directed RNA polymerase delta subunit
MDFDDLVDDINNLPEKITNDLQDKIGTLYCNICNKAPQITKTEKGFEVHACEHMQEEIERILEQD